MSPLPWSPPPEDDDDGALYFVIFALVFTAVVVLGQMFR